MSDRPEQSVNSGRRRVLRATLALSAGGALSAMMPPFPRAAFAQGGRGRGAAAAPAAPAGTRLVLLGTQGGPNVNSNRSEAGNAIVVDGRPYLVDCGYGTLRRLADTGIGATQVGAIFLTHLHDDHTSDIPALLTHQWTGSRAQPTVVYGPAGTSRLVAAAVEFLKPNAEIRMIDEGRTVPPEKLYRGQDVSAATPMQVFADDRVKVTCVENTHFKDSAKAAMSHRSVAYRFDTPMRSIVISGDTAYSTSLIALAKGADLFVCEAMDLAMHETMMAQAKAAADAGNPNSIARHIAETHVTTIDVGRMAAAAGVNTVVLTHLAPGNRPGATEIPDTTWIDGVRQHFTGSVIVGRDQMIL